MWNKFKVINNKDTKTTSLLLILNMFYIFFYCFYYWLRASVCLLDSYTSTEFSNERATTLIFPYSVHKGIALYFRIQCTKTYWPNKVSFFEFLLCKSINWFLYDNGLRHQRVNIRALNPVKIYTVWNIVISPNFLVGKIFGKAQFSHSFGRITRNYAETVSVRKFSTPGN